MRKVTLIVNPTAGRGRTARLVEVLQRAQGPDCEVLVTRAPGEARELAGSRRDDTDRVVVAVGGDGTVHEVGGALVGAEAIFGVLPAGSGNDFAKMLAEPPPPESAAEYFASAEVRRCDAGEIRIRHADGRSTQRYFINGVGIGFEAVVADAASRARWLGGSARYIVSAVRRLLTYRAPDAVLRFDGREVAGPLFLVAVGNGRCAGGHFYLTPEAAIDDGLFDICFTTTRSIPRLLRRLPAALRGRHLAFDDIELERSQAMQLQCPDGCMIHADGELLARNAVEVEVDILPGALRLAG
ncbi:diacylglycerol kinase family lipid kinase [Wenzhouxiangella sp. XN201]|uniref:diacylglycerol/lipid kinase family protein n=1 Tax=Wenzhouxiangella sp. XN201 TaxID=2710755 RepID=UPI0013CAC1DE|nr:diacylglycerol kinase family protein [Wenzhouxiangella sp. XN201]NEZ05093.1 diacylglycerol kinase family lipid kinase [Wenzhouxiangella sp. XN201]